MATIHSASCASLLPARYSMPQHVHACAHTRHTHAHTAPQRPLRRPCSPDRFSAWPTRARTMFDSSTREYPDYLSAHRYPFGPCSHHVNGSYPSCPEETYDSPTCLWVRTHVCAGTRARLLRDSATSAPGLAHVCAGTRARLRRDSRTSAPGLAHVCAGIDM
jgi:hypothetical protein